MKMISISSRVTVLLFLASSKTMTEGKSPDTSVLFPPSPKLMSPNPNPYQVRYNDGTMSPLIELKVIGSITSPHHEIYEETLDGFVVKPKNGKYRYMDVDESTGNYVDSGFIAGYDNPVSLNVTINAATRRQKILTKLRSNKRVMLQNHVVDDDIGQGRRAMISSGVLNNLVVPFRFSDHVNRNLPSRSALYTLMNNDGPHSLCPTGSVRDVYLKSSFNQLDIQSSVVEWITIDYTESFCANSQHGTSTKIHLCLTNALDKLKATGFDFSDFDRDNDGKIDSITFFHSGYAAEFGGFDAYGTMYKDRIWSHKWSLYTVFWQSNGVRINEYNINPAIWGITQSNIGRIGVVAHELGHYIGLPDLYDYGDGEGLGSYCLMANSWGIDGTQYYPPHMSAWSKYELGWVNPIVADTPGSYSLKQACDYPDIIKISNGYPNGEYILIENRQPCNFDSKTTQGGLAIFHVDEKANNVRGFPSQSGWPDNKNHYIVALLQADGVYNLEKGNNRGDQYDLFHAKGVNTIGPNGISGSIRALHPNTNAYRNGEIINTDLNIFNIGPSSWNMTLDISFSPPSVVSPTVSPTKSPVATCDDSSSKFLIKLKNGKWKKKTCFWVKIKPRPRCKLVGAPESCPSTCGSCVKKELTCDDSSMKFLIELKNGNSKEVTCSWVEIKSGPRCKLVGASESCPSTCGACIYKAF